MQKNSFISLPERHIIRISGEDASRFLQGIITNDIEHVTAERSIYALVLTPQGKYIYDFFIAKQGDAFLLDVLEDTKATLLKKLKMYKLRAKVTIEDISATHHVTAYIGDNSYSALNMDNTSGATESQEDSIYYVEPRHTGLGLRSITSQEKPALEGFSETDNKNYDGLRIALGIPEGQKDMISEGDFPLPFGMEALNAIDFQKGCYVGQEVTARSKHRGNIRKAVYRVEGNGELPNQGTDIMAGDKKLGALLSHQENKGIALIRQEDFQKAAENGATITADNRVITLTKPDWA